MSNIERLVYLGKRHDLQEGELVVSSVAAWFYWRLVEVGLIYSPLVHRYRKRWWQL
jgi:hypothetical protein